MKRKIALNVFYNLGLIISVFGIFWSVQNSYYLATALFVATAAFFLYIKIQLIKDLRNTLKNKGKDL
jgi:hypothetical protein